MTTVTERLERWMMQGGPNCVSEWSEIAPDLRSLLARVEGLEGELRSMTDRWSQAGHAASERSNQLQHALNKNAELSAELEGLKSRRDGSSGDETTDARCFATATEAQNSAEMRRFEADLAERRADPEWVAKWSGGEEAKTPLVTLVHYLRADEGDSITLLSDNPDFNGLPNNAVDCCGAWTDWGDRRFWGDTLHAAVLAAYRAKQEATSSEEQRQQSEPQASAGNAGLDDQ